MSLKTIFSDATSVYSPVDANSWNSLNSTNVTYSQVLTFNQQDDTGHVNQTTIPVVITKLGAGNMIVSLQLSQLTYDGCIINAVSHYPYKSSVPLPAGLFNPDKDIEIGITSGCVFGNSNDVARPCPFTWSIDTEGYIYYLQSYQTGYTATYGWSYSWTAPYHYHPSCSTTGAVDVRTAITDGTILYTNSTFIVSLL